MIEKGEGRASTLMGLNFGKKVDFIDLLRCIGLY
jgi:hypothetical protein